MIKNISKKASRLIYKEGMSFFYKIKPFKLGQIIIVLFHDIIDEKIFSWQVQVLKQHYNVISLYELISFVKKGNLNNNRYAAITFDDGFKSNYKIAYKILQKLNIPATFYISPGYIDKKNNLYVTWDMLKEIITSDIISIGNHTYNHFILSTLDIKQQRQEILNGKERLEDTLGINITSFAYPYGQPWHYTNETVNILRNEGYDFAVTAFPKSISGSIISEYEIPRIVMDGINKQKDFEIRLSNIWSTIQCRLTQLKNLKYQLTV